MKIAISNLSWERFEDIKILSLLLKYGIKGLEIAPTKIWDNPINTSVAEVEAYKKYWLANGISIIATTSLLYGHPELTIFENSKVRKKALKYLFEIIKLSAYLGVKAMVFGSPKNRQTYGLKKEEVLRIAQEFFFLIGEQAKKYNILFGIEPNPTYYGTDFINTTEEAIELIQIVNHSNFRLHMDSGAMALNKEDYKKTIREGLPYTCHFHLSEPMLKEVKEGIVNHKEIAKVLRRLNYDKWVSIEMPLLKDVNHQATIERVLKFITGIYA